MILLKCCKLQKLNEKFSGVLTMACDDYYKMKKSSYIRYVDTQVKLYFLFSD